MSPDQQRAAADYVSEQYDISQRRICRILGRSRSVLRYRRRRQSDEPALNREIKRLARRHPRFGYRMIHALLLRRGWTINIKRVRRLWIELGLKRPVRLRKPRKLGPKPGTSANSCVNQPTRFKNDVWTCDFIHDRTAEWSSAQVADVGGRIYSRVLGAARSDVDRWSRRPADHGTSHWSARSSDAYQKR